MLSEKNPRGLKKNSGLDKILTGEESMSSEGGKASDVEDSYATEKVIWRMICTHTLSPRVIQLLARANMP